MIYSYNIKNNLNPRQENAMTSTLFGMLLTFPDELIWAILWGAIADREALPAKVGRLLEYRFWPKWDPTDTENVNYVEPDVFLRFEDCDVIVEAKRSDSPYLSPQIYNEWKRETIAYRNEYGGDKRMILIAVGGNQNDRFEMVNLPGNDSIGVSKIAWASLLFSVNNIAERTESGHIKRLCDIMIQGFAMHQIAIFNWMASVEHYPVSAQAIDLISHNYFPKIKPLKRYFDFDTAGFAIAESSSEDLNKFFNS